MNLACWGTSQEPGGWSGATEKEVEEAETKGLIRGPTPAPSLSSISFLLPGALPGMQKDKDGGLKVLHSKIVGFLEYKPSIFQVRKLRAQQGLAISPEPQGSLNAELGRNLSSEPLGHSVSPFTASIRVLSPRALN